MTSCTDSNLRDASSNFVKFAVAIVISLVVLALTPSVAHAYSYLTTSSPNIFNRGWVAVGSGGQLELIGSDPIGPNYYMPSWQNASEHSKISKYQFAIWSNYNGQDDVIWYDGYPGSWTRGGAGFGTGSTSGAGSGTGMGCIPTYGYGVGFIPISRHGGFDSLILNHVYIESTGVSGVVQWYNYAAMSFWPRVKIAYDANGGANAPAAHFKRIGDLAYISNQKPTRVGYTFEGWSTKKNGPVNIAPGQKIGYEDWNLQSPIGFGHDWNNGPSAWYGDTRVGQPNPTGSVTSNVIPLYAQWKPITYTIAYNGNGATGGYTAPSYHVYDSTSSLNKSGFVRSYSLECDSNGGSSGVVKVSCNWTWKAWNTKPNGNGTGYYNQQAVRNLRSAPGTLTLYQIWNPGHVSLPSPGSRANFEFAGWYTAKSGGQRLGGAGDSVTIPANTKVYAQWKPLTKVEYYVDGEFTPVWSETVYSDKAYSVKSAATAAGTKLNCEAFDSWYSDAGYSRKFIDGSVISGNVYRLYGRNSVTLEYRSTSESTILNQVEFDLYVDPDYETQLEDPQSLYPTKASYWYGDVVDFDFSRVALYYKTQRIDRQLKPSAGAYLVDSRASGLKSSTKLVQNTVAYVDWPWPVYDGVLDQRE